MRGTELRVLSHFIPGGGASQSVIASNQCTGYVCDRETKSVCMRGGLIACDEILNPLPVCVCVCLYFAFAGDSKMLMTLLNGCG